jgi:hypothetical protein
MVKLDNDYWHALDREAAQKYDVSPNSVGISTPPMRDQIESLKARIFQGVSRVELGFMGTQKGSAGQGAFTPEVYGKHERDALKQMAKVNEVQLTTHAAPSVAGLSGITERGFTDEQAEKNLIELKRTIDFASDVAESGPVVMHTGEFPQPITSTSGIRSETDKKGNPLFEGFEGERETGLGLLADRDTGQLIQLKKDMKLEMPRKKVEYRNQNGNGNGENYEVYERNEDGTLIFDTKTIGQLEKERGSLQSVYKEYIAKDKQMNEGEARRYALQAKDAEKQYNEIKKAIEGAKKVYDSNPDYGNEFARELARELRLPVPNKFSSDFKEYLDNPFKYLKKAENQLKQQVDSTYEISSSYQRRSEDSKRQIGYINEKGEKIKGTVATVEEIGLEKSAKTMGEAGLYAMEKSKSKKDPIFIAPENIFPESGYGGHPKELKNLILKSRESMSQTLQKKGKSKQVADNLAKNHIKATFDIGHANTWKKYFKGNDKEFSEWMKKQVQDLAKDEIIGHVHVSDNFGYYDEHVDPGQGNAPISEFISTMKESGYKGKIIVEPGAQDIRAWTSMLRSMNSPIYRIDGATSSWTDVENSFVGQTYSPTYVVGEFAPDASLQEEHRGWRFWSGTPIE